MEVKLRILFEFFKEQLKKSIDILGSSNCVGSSTASIRVTNVERLTFVFRPVSVTVFCRTQYYLVQENDASIVVPRVFVNVCIVTCFIDNTWTVCAYMLLNARETSFPYQSFFPYPNSMNKPVKEEQPGPPLSQRTSGSSWGLLRDSKNQKKKCLSSSTSK